MLHIIKSKSSTFVVVVLFLYKCNYFDKLIVKFGLLNCVVRSPWCGFEQMLNRRTGGVMLCKQKQQHYGIVYFCSDNKQWCRKTCFCFLSVLGERQGCCPRHQHWQEVGNCRAGTMLLPARRQVQDMGRKLVAALSILKSTWPQPCLTPITLTAYHINS